MRYIVIALLVWGLSSPISAQEVFQERGNFPITLSIQFQSFGLPFKNLKHNFKNLGIGLGTEFKWGGQGATVQ